MSKFLGATVNLGATEAAALTLGASFVKGLLGACLTGEIDPYGRTLAVAEDIAEQAIAHPQHYHRPPKI
jgi:hypothetical protein